MNKIQSKRLLNVARALREAHAAKMKFNMEKFVYGNRAALEDGAWNTETCDYSPSTNREKNFCGTPACALGHYAARTDLQRIVKIAIVKDDDGAKYAEVQMFGTSDDMDFADERLLNHFGIEYDEMDELFNHDGCGGARTALQAAKYIEQFVAKKMHPGRSNKSNKKEIDVGYCSFGN